MCNVYEVLDKLTGAMSLDWGLISEQLTNIAVYMGMEAMDIVDDIVRNLGEDCLENAVVYTNSLANDLIDEAYDYLEEGDVLFDVDGKELGTMIGGEIMDCLVHDMNLYEVGHDAGLMISNMLQTQIDPTN